MKSLDQMRADIRKNTRASEAEMVARLMVMADLSSKDRASIADAAADFVRDIRTASKPGLMEVFLAEYGLSTQEGIALMCLAEALLRVPDPQTVDALIEDKIAPSDWGRHLGHSASPMVNVSTWALMLTGKVLEPDHPGMAGQLRAMIKRLGEPVIRTAVSRAIKEMGRQFVLGETIEAAMKRAAEREAEGYSYSYDMLGEAAMTAQDAETYLRSYEAAIDAIAATAQSSNIRDNPGISVKLSAIYPRYEETQRAAVLRDLVPVLNSLLRRAASAGVGLNIDAEESWRLDLSLDVIEAALRDPELAGWEGFGVVVQAYGPRAGGVIDWLYAMAGTLDRKIMVRLVKGAYWDTEIKRAQVMGLGGFPVFTRKEATDISYIANARKLLGMRDRIYAQFATHNAHSAAAILQMAGETDGFEFQRLHGMGERLHEIVMARHGTRCRIYAPVGAHKDLLAYLVRRLLENGANSSFVNQIVDEDVPPELVGRDPFAAIEGLNYPAVTAPEEIFDGRVNSQGWDWEDPLDCGQISDRRDAFLQNEWRAAPRGISQAATAEEREVVNPATQERVGCVRNTSLADVPGAIGAAQLWTAEASERAQVLSRAAELFEANAEEVFALLCREAGKTLPDAISELREAVDFLRYYAMQIPQHAQARGVFVCISPWNFPLAIFTGQIAAALAAGNAVLAKPAEQTPLIADLAVRLLHQAGVPAAALRNLPGSAEIGAALVKDPRVAAVCFTGSTGTAQSIHRALANEGNAEAILIAETGGLNAMIVDSTALAEQAVRDVIASAFQSAGQRCSALRCLYVQEDIAPSFIQMLTGAMDLLNLGDPWDLCVDVGPIIDTAAQARIADYVAKAKARGRVIHACDTPDHGHFIGPTLIEVAGIEEMGEEIFGPVLHLARFAPDQLDAVIDAVNATGYGLTFGLHTRIDGRIQHVLDRVEAGNIYVNRNQIGAVVGSQPFGGEGLSGTGPKAGGPLYVAKFCKDTYVAPPKAQDMHGPTGEANHWRCHAKRILCLGPDIETQMRQVTQAGGIAVQKGAHDMVYWSGDPSRARNIRQELAAQDGPIRGLLTSTPMPSDVLFERHSCIDTTASGGNAALLAEVAG